MSKDRQQTSDDWNEMVKEKEKEKITLIVFTGKKLSGKTTAGKYLVENYDYVRLRFANTLKDMLYAFGLTEAEVDGDLKELPCAKLGGKTPVQAMQILGTEWGREMIYPDIWVDALNRELERYVDAKLTRFVIDDLRFVSEKAYLDRLREKYNVLVVRIEREGVALGSHKSETEMDKIEAEFHIDNSYRLEVLHKVLDDMIKWYANKEK
jgi:hypothetical protein